MIKYNFCPKCGSKDPVQINGVVKCNSCGKNIYLHSAATASVFIVKGGKVLLAVRKYEPKKGTLDSVGGFVNYGEHPNNSAHREVLEETGLKINILHDLSVNMDSYNDQGEEVSTLNFAYIAEIKSGNMKVKEDVADLVWFDINKIPFEKVGYETIKKNLKEIQKWYIKK